MSDMEHRRQAVINQKERLNAGYAATAKKQRLAIQSIAEYIRKTEKEPAKALAWAQTQELLLKNLTLINEEHFTHRELYPSDPEDKDTPDAQGPATPQES